MTTLHLNASTMARGSYKIEILLEEPDQPVTIATSHLAFTLTPEDKENLRWYFEDFLLYPFEPAPQIAVRTELRMREIGADLFEQMFLDCDAGRALWARARPRLDQLRIEIVADPRADANIPWELLRAEEPDAPLALCVQSFVHAPGINQGSQPPRQTSSGPPRILLVICRPRREEDVPFRSVAMRVVQSLERRNDVHLEVLRPPTIDQLVKHVINAHEMGQAYQIVHFDGHGIYTNPVGEEPGPISRRRGYLEFESSDGRVELVHGKRLAEELRRGGVPVLVLNACRSAYAEVHDAPTKPGDERARAFGSFAREAIGSGMLGVVAMRYNVHVTTAANFVAGMYKALARGMFLAEAVTSARKDLATGTDREHSANSRTLQDWAVPSVYESTPARLVASRKAEHAEHVTALPTPAASRRSTDGITLPRGPVAGFFGRDDTLLELDRAFDTHRLVLLHSYAGSGKTTAAVEFARWYSRTSGIDGPVLFTTFGRYQPLRLVIEEVGRVFREVLGRRGLDWLRLSDDERQNESLQLLTEYSVLWIWDNVELVTGFPTGAASGWSGPEQRELAEFLETARQTRAKFLLTSRRDERAWLGELPERVTLQPMPMADRVVLAQALATAQGRRLAEVQDWRPLLDFTQGNPLTITVLVGQALRDRLQTRQQVEAFVGELRDGAARFEDEPSEGRSSSLGASLNYGFERSFSDSELRLLSLLHLFREFVDIEALRWMGHHEVGNFAALRRLSGKSTASLLDRASEIGLLTRYDGGVYGIHPALPWFFRGLFGRYYSTTEAGEVSPTRAYVHAIAAIGVDYFDHYMAGHPTVIDALRAEEANLLHARQLAESHGWWDLFISATQGLRVLYDHLGRRSEWARLVGETVPHFVDPQSDGPLLGREADWNLVTEYRVELALAMRQRSRAEHLQRLRVDFERRDAAAALALPPDQLDEMHRRKVQALGTALSVLGGIVREQGEASCVGQYQEALELFQRLGDRTGESHTAVGLGHAFVEIAAIRDLDRAESWYQRSLESRGARDRIGQGRCWSQLGLVAYERFRDARAAGRPDDELMSHLTNAEKRYKRALALTPKTAVPELAIIHNQLGVVSDLLSEPSAALNHYRESVRYEVEQGNIAGAAIARLNYAIAAEAVPGQLANAISYAQAALRDFESLGEAYSAERDNVRGVIEQLQREVTGTIPPVTDD